MIEAVIFDLGGTLIDYTGQYASWPDLETPGLMAAYDQLKQRHIAMPRYQSFLDTGFGMLPERWQQAARGTRNLRLVELLAEILRACSAEEVTGEVLGEAAEAYQEAICGQATLMPGAQETLQSVRSHGWKVGLISNTMFTGEAHRRDLERFGLVDYFDAMLFSADVNQWKPNAAPFLTVLSELNVPSSAAVFIGDDPAVDVVGGQRAGLRTVHVKSSDRFADDGIEAQVQISSLVELPAILSRWT